MEVERDDDGLSLDNEPHVRTSETPGRPTSPSEVSHAIEAVLLVSGRPVTPKSLADAVGCSLSEAKSALRDLSERYAEGKSGIVLLRAAGGYLLSTSPLCAGTVERFRREARPSPLSGAAHEVLSCVLYLGPISRGAISRVRGVNSDAVVRNMIERNLLRESGRESEAPGAASLLDVTEDFHIATATSSRDDFPALDSLVSDEELDRVRERVRQDIPTDVPTDGPVDSQRN